MKGSSEGKSIRNYALFHAVVFSGWLVARVPRVWRVLSLGILLNIFLKLAPAGFDLGTYER